MNKALIIFTGNYAIEQALTTEVVNWDYLNLTQAWQCKNCTVNQQAAQAYLEAKEATNDWQEILDAYYNKGLVFSIAGHGFVCPV
jgi:TPP-dependent 2-oxoacid decarboxylase